MSIASISYCSLENASMEASIVAKKFAGYAENLKSQVYDKLDKYSDNNGVDISVACDAMSAKIKELNDYSELYNKNSQNFLDLEDQCIATDKAVKSQISNLTASFKAANGIKDSKVLNAINYFFTSIENSTAVGRWIGNKFDEASSSLESFKNSIKKLYNYDGGKEALQGILLGALEVAIAVVTVIGTVGTGGALIVAIAACIGAGIAIFDAGTNIINEVAAINAIQNNDPATGRRRRDINSFQDYLRSSFYGDGNGDTYEYSKGRDMVATGIGVVNLACSVVSIVHSGKELLKNGYKWVTGSNAQLANIKWNQVFSMDTLTKCKTKFTGIWTSLKTNKWTTFKDFGTQIYKDFGRNFKGEFLDFSGRKQTCSSIKNILTVPKDILKGGVSISNVFKVGFNNIVLPSSTAFTVNSVEGTMVLEDSGQYGLDFTKKITLGKIVGFGKKVIGTIKSGSGLLSNDSVIDSKVLEKLSKVNSINNSIPDVYTPDTELSILRNAA